MWQLLLKLLGMFKQPTSLATPKKEPYMIKESEINPKAYSMTEEQAKNMPILLERINKIRAAYAKPMTVTSGLRSMDDHLRIYKAKGVSEDKIPMGSSHLKGAAVDIRDSDGALAKWCHENVKLLEEVGLWMEATEYTIGWCHFQIFSPKSGNRFFKP
jgi:hypothetical protein